MNWTNTRHGYGLLQILLHWITVLGIATLIPLGLWMTGLDYYDPWYKKGPDLHRAIGVMLGALVILRLCARLVQARPAPLDGDRLRNRLAGITHALLYLLPLLLVTSGYLVSTADGRSVDVFGWFSVPATVHGIDGQEDIAGDVHFILAMSLLAVIAAHAAAALHHHLVLKDATLRRMLKPSQH
jgi:cytochrome b561